jgi:hypothetical protein
MPRSTSQKVSNVQDFSQLKYLDVTSLEERQAKRYAALGKGVRGPSLKEKRDLSVPLGISSKLSTKLLLMEATRIFKVKSQSQLNEQILLKGLIHLFEKVGYDWQEFLDSHEILKDD